MKKPKGGSIDERLKNRMRNSQAAKLAEHDVDAIEQLYNELGIQMKPLRNTAFILLPIIQVLKARIEELEDSHRIILPPGG